MSGIQRWSFISVLSVIAAIYFSLALFSERISFGSDRDDYLVGYSAERISHHRAYEASRLPGFPVFECLISYFVSSRDARPAKVANAVF